jgi:exopolysaccharide biosynthesis WecB/TagA/CpsF family protein
MAESRSDGAILARSIPPRRTISVLGVRIDKLTREQALGEIDGWGVGRPRMLAYVNAHTLNLTVHDHKLREVLNRCDLVMNDGSGLSLAARLHGERFPENLNGSDFTVCLLGLAASRGWGVFLLGGRPGVADTAACRLTEQIEGLRVVGTCHGFTGEREDLLAHRVRDSAADLLIVALGNPLQELWLDRNLDATGAHVGVGVGAFLDFSAEAVRRAPRWMNVLGVEWCFRLVQEPLRLWRRYLLGNPLFLARVLREQHTHC